MNIVVRCLVACVACLGYLVATGLQSATTTPAARSEVAPASAAIAILPPARGVE